MRAEFDTAASSPTEVMHSPVVTAPSPLLDGTGPGEVRGPASPLTSKPPSLTGSSTETADSATTPTVNQPAASLHPLLPPRPKTPPPLPPRVSIESDEAEVVLGTPERKPRIASMAPSLATDLDFGSFGELLTSEQRKLFLAGSP
jgi:hypothetical protein